MKITLVWLFFCSHLCLANGIARWGFGAADSSTAGSFSATGGDPLATLQGNAAAMPRLGVGSWTVSAQALAGCGDYSRSGESYDLENAYGVLPEAALVLQIPDQPIWLGASFAATSALQSDWNYPDVPGGIGQIAYPDADHESGFLALTANLGLAWRANEQWSFGATIGIIHSRVDFDAPFIFQTNPALAGAKVDLDLETSGWAPAFDAGVLWTPEASWSFGFRVRAESSLDNDGSARADFSSQLPPLGLAGTDPIVHYDASTENTLPLAISFGTAWQSTEKLRFGASVEWLNWSDSFDEFPVRLSNGSNAAINSAIGQAPEDDVPLRWEDRFVLALGTEYALASGTILRAGWRYAETPVPSELVTPLNGSIFEHAFALGAGWDFKDWKIDVSYTISLGEENIGLSGYRAGEYSNSTIDVVAHSMGISLSRAF